MLAELDLHMTSLVMPDERTPPRISDSFYRFGVLFVGLFLECAATATTAPGIKTKSLT